MFISLLGGVPLCIPYGLYSGTSLGGTTRRILGGFPGRVLSAWYQSSRFLNSLGLYIAVQLIQCFVYLPNLTLEIDYVSFILGNSSSSWWRTEVDVGPIRLRWKFYMHLLMRKILSSAWLDHSRGVCLLVLPLIRLVDLVQWVLMAPRIPWWFYPG